MVIAGYTAALLMGVLLGLIGGGGSIMTVPILVYLFGINPTLATAYSLFIVGTSSLAGSISHFRKGNVNLSMAVYFGLPSMVSVFMIRNFIVPSIPDTILSIGTTVLTRDNLILSLFAVLMVAAAYTMVRPGNGKSDAGQKKQMNHPLIIFEGLIVGALTGLVGAGGGFLIVPALVLFAGLPMKEAIGTSLLIITIKSLIGFIGDTLVTSGMDYTFLLKFTAFAIIGIMVGSNLTKVIDNQKLKPAFGWFILISGLTMLLEEWGFQD